MRMGDVIHPAERGSAQNCLDCGHSQPSRDWAKFVPPSRWLKVSAPVGRGSIQCPACVRLRVALRALASVFAPVVLRRDPSTPCGLPSSLKLRRDRSPRQAGRRDKTPRQGGVHASAGMPTIAHIMRIFLLPLRCRVSVWLSRTYGALCLSHSDGDSRLANHSLQIS